MSEWEPVKPDDILGPGKYMLSQGAGMTATFTFTLDETTYNIIWSVGCNLFTVENCLPRPEVDSGRLYRWTGSWVPKGVVLRRTVGGYLEMHGSFWALGPGVYDLRAFDGSYLVKGALSADNIVLGDVPLDLVWHGFV